MNFLYSDTFLAVMGVLLLDVSLGLALLGMARTRARLGDWPASDRWYRWRLAAPLPATRLLLDRLHGQGAFVQYERLRAMAAFGRFEDAAVLGAALSEADQSPAWLRTAAGALSVGQLAQVGHFEPALSRLGALLSDLPENAAGVRGLVHVLRLPLLLALGRWAEAESCARAVDDPRLLAKGEWPSRRLLTLLMRDEERHALALARPVLERSEEQDAEGDSDEASRVGLLLAARAAEEIGWAELRDRLLVRLQDGPEPEVPTPLVSGLQAVAAAERSDAVALDAALRQAASGLERLNHASGPVSETERLLVRAESRAGRHDAAIERGNALLRGAVSPLGRWRAARALGEAAEAAGRTETAHAAYREALAAGIATRLVPEIERRVAALSTA